MRGSTFWVLLTAVLVPSIIICIVCFVISIAGVMLGERLEDILGKKMAIIGGLIIILIWGQYSCKSPVLVNSGLSLTFTRGISPCRNEC